MKVVLAKTYGFCFGVKRAIEIAQRERAKGKKQPTFVLNEIVHNPQVVADLAEKGIKSVKSLKEIPRGSTVIFSAHGVSPKVFRQAQKKGLKIIDATCPLVLKVHALARKLARQDYQIIYLGDPRHDEVIGVVGEAPQKIIALDIKKGRLDSEELGKIKNPPKLALITQTTLSLQEAQEAIKFLQTKFPQIVLYNTICQATTQRQQAVLELSQKVDLVVVVGGKKSANSQRLKEVAQEYKPAFLVEKAKDLSQIGSFRDKIIGVTAGASTPEQVTQEVVEGIKNWTTK